MDNDTKNPLKSVYEDVTIKSIVGSLKVGSVWTAKKVWEFSPKTVWEGISSTATRAKKAVTPTRKPKRKTTIDLSSLVNMTPEDLMAFVQSQMDTSVIVVNKSTGEVVDTIDDAQFVVKSMDPTEEEPSLSK